MKKTTQTFQAWAIMPPDGWDNNFRARDSLRETREGAWERFCYPALDRAAFESDGFKSVNVDVTISLSADTD